MICRGAWDWHGQAQSTKQSPIEKARTAVESLINRLRGRDMPEGIVKSNGRIEATQVDVSAKYPGRLVSLTVNEGDEVTGGQVVARISSPETEAQLRGAQAQVLRAKQALAEANALIVQRKSDLDFARTDYDRAKQLIERGHVSLQVADARRNKFEAAEAAYVAANAQRDGAEAAIKAAEADVERLQSILVDLVLVSPRSGRVQYRLARAGEVVSAGQRILTILDLKDVYMTIYLPADKAGKLALGDEARTILDPLPQYVLPNTISFVATEAQFKQYGSLCWPVARLRRIALAPGHCLGDEQPSDPGAGGPDAYHGRGTPTACERPAASYGPWVPVRHHHVPRVAGRSRSDGEHESARELLGQCRGRKFLPHAENGTRASSALSNTRGRHAGCV